MSFCGSKNFNENKNPNNFFLHRDANYVILEKANLTKKSKRKKDWETV